MTLPSVNTAHCLFAQNVNITGLGGPKFTNEEFANLTLNHLAALFSIYPNTVALSDAICHI